MSVDLRTDGPVAKGELAQLRSEFPHEAGAAVTRAGTTVSITLTGRTDYYSSTPRHHELVASCITDAMRTVQQALGAQGSTWLVTRVVAEPYD